MADKPTVTLKLSHRYRGSPERVFDAWLDPATAGKWLFATPTGKIVRVEIDARVGGRFLVVRRDGEDVEHVGEYLEIERPRRLVFAFGVPKFSSEMSIVTVEIVPHEAGAELLLTQACVPPERAKSTEQGWAMILDRLERFLSFPD